MTKTILTAAVIGAALFTLTSHRPAPPPKQADLRVKSISEPQWDHKNNRTIVEVEIENVGKLKANAFKVKLYDVDISPEQGKKLKLEKYLIELLEENQSRAQELSREPDKDKHPITSAHTFFSDEYVTDYDYDMYFQVVKDVDGLGKGQTVKIRFTIEGHWIYDSNCEIGVILDIEDTVKERREDNNQDYFFGWG